MDISGVIGHPETFLGRPLNKLDIDEVRMDESLTQLVRAGKMSKETALNLSIPKAQKSLSADTQYVRDEHGRKRFHGAFTGGFSAGYFNTVGSAEGWTPSQFQSSRTQKAQVQVDKTCREYYMDEEDFQTFDLDKVRGKKEKLLHQQKLLREKENPQNIDTEEVDPETLNIPRAKEKTETTLEEDIIKKSVLDDLFVEIDLDVGFEILKELGWKEGSLLFTPKVVRAPPSEPVNRNEICPPLPPGMERKKSKKPELQNIYTENGVSYNPLTVHFYKIPLEEEIQWFEDCRKIQMESLKYTSNPLLVLADIRYGRGYQPKKNVRDLISTSKKIKSQSEAFGTGVLEDKDDSWDDIYDASYDTHAEKKQAIEQANDSDDEDPLFKEEPFEFVDAQHDYDNQIWEDPVLKSMIKHLSIGEPPPHYRGHYDPGEVEKEYNRKWEIGDFEPGFFRDNFEHVNKYNPSSEVELEQKEVQPLEQEDMKLPIEKPLWASVTDEVKKAMIYAVSSNVKFVKPVEISVQHSSQPLNLYYPNDEKKQHRYELFDEEIPASYALRSDATLTASQLTEERKEFGGNYKKFRAQYPGIKLIAHCSELTRELLKIPKNRKIESLDAKKSYRVEYNIKFDPLLYRRFKVKDPWENKEYKENKTNNVKDKALTMQSSRFFVSELTTILENQKKEEAEPKKKVVEEKNLDLTHRAPESIFNAVFGFDDEF